MPRLRAIARRGRGHRRDRPETPRASAGIAVLTAGEALVETTADLAFALIIAACAADAARPRATLRAGRWHGWGFIETLGRDVHGATLGLVGYGAIGRAVARRAAGFAMEVLHHTRTHDRRARLARASSTALLADSDIVSLHVPLTRLHARPDRRPPDRA